VSGVLAHERWRQSLNLSKIGHSKALLLRRLPDVSLKRAVQAHTVPDIRIAFNLMTSWSGHTSLSLSARTRMLLAFDIAGFKTTAPDPGSKPGSKIAECSFDGNAKAEGERGAMSAADVLPCAGDNEGADAMSSADVLPCAGDGEGADAMSSADVLPCAGDGEGADAMSSADVLPCAGDGEGADAMSSADVLPCAGDGESAGEFGAMPSSIVAPSASSAREPES